MTKARIYSCWPEFTMDAVEFVDLAYKRRSRDERFQVRLLAATDDYDCGLEFSTTMSDQVLLDLLSHDADWNHMRESMRPVPLAENHPGRWERAPWERIEPATKPNGGVTSPGPSV